MLLYNNYATSCRVTILQKNILFWKEVVGKRFNNSAVNLKIVEIDVAIMSFGPNQAIAEVTTISTLDTRPVTILHIDIVDVAAVVQAIEHYGILALLTDDVTQVDIAYDGIVSTLGNLARIVVEVDTKHGFAAATNIDVAYIDILNDAPTCRRCLDTNYSIEIGRIHLAILHPKILVTTGNLRADDNATMTVSHRTLTNNHVLRRNATVTTVLITSRFDSDAVITRMENTVLDKDTIAAFRIASITIRTIVINSHSTYNKVFAKKWM